MISLPPHLISIMWSHSTALRLQDTYNPLGSKRPLQIPPCSLRRIFRLVDDEDAILESLVHVALLPFTNHALVAFFISLEYSFILCAYRVGCGVFQFFHMY